MTNSKLPQRYPFVGPLASYTGVPADVIGRFACAVREWADQPFSRPGAGVWRPPASGAPTTRENDASR
ncbi:hypothetical protein ACIHDR_33255 [Nocardia sp. NPDC052278]|uniref:hypothetical protein n=1 Tax=unclassified Nocardia TaxID=2637762 RepID=UPI0036A86328